MEKALFLYNGCSGKGRIDREAGAIAGILGAAGYRVETLPETAVEEMRAGEWDLTLFTCTYDGRARVTVRCIRTEE